MTNHGHRAPTAEDFDLVISFITARLAPLRREPHHTGYNADVELALVGLTDLVHVIWGTGMGQIKLGQDASTELWQLDVVAKRWRDHPDYRQGWNASKTPRGPAS